MKKRTSMFKNKALIAPGLSLLMTASLGLASFSPALALENLDDVGLFNSITVTRNAREAAKQAKSSQWEAALRAYRQAIANASNSPESKDLFYGLYNAAQKSNDWNTAGQALDTIFENDPTAKAHLLAEYGQVLTNQNRFDEAIPVLKKALATADTDQNFLPTKLRELMIKTETVKEVPKRELTQEEKDRMIAEVTPRKIEHRETVRGEDVNVQHSANAKSFENAYSYCEFIGICVYEGYEKSPDITFFHPPIANFKIEKILKGPKLNRTFPVRFEFHDKTAKDRPKDWKFSEDMMPKKGSRWLLFTDAAIPTNGAFETFRGNFGRMEATDENLDQIYRVIELHRGQQ